MKELVVMCGVPGAGKTTFVKEQMEKLKNKGKSCGHCSRDAIRFALVKEEEEYFSHENEVWDLFIKAIKDSLIQNEITFADATHLNQASRTKLLRALGTSLRDVTVSACSIESSEENCLVNNERRAGTRSFVPRGVIRRMGYQYTTPTEEEGFTNVVIIKGDKYE